MTDSVPHETATAATVGDEPGPVETMDRAAIMAAIPHRDPFLWLDSVSEITDQRIVCQKTVTESLDVFQGHYPDFPVLPGVLQLECCFQASAVLIARTMPTGGDIPVITRVNNVQFRQMVRPGQTLEIEVEIVDRVSKAYDMKGRIRVDGKLACRVEFVATAAPRPA